MSRAAAARRSRSCSSESSPRRRQGDTRASKSASAFHMFPTPATRRWSRRASPTSRPWSPARRRASMPSRSGGAAMTSGPRRATAGERPRVSSSTGPFQRTACSSRPRRTSHGVPNGSVPAACTRQRPFMRRWLRRTRPPSKPSTRFLPPASTRSRRRPSSRSTSRSTAARGCGVSTATTSPSSTRSRAAARWRASPSGIRPPSWTSTRDEREDSPGCRLPVHAVALQRGARHPALDRLGLGMLLGVRGDPHPGRVPRALLSAGLSASRPQHGPPRPREEAGLEEERHDLRLADRLAVEALHRQAPHARAAGMGDEGLESRPQPGLLGLAQRDERAAAALDEKRRLAAEQDDLGAGHAGGPRSRALRPGEGCAVRLRGIGGGEHERALLLRPLAEALHRAGEGELGAAEPLDEIAAPADPERLHPAELAVHGGVAARDSLGADAVARHDPLPLEQELRERAWLGLAREETVRRRPAPLRRGDRVGPGAGEAAWVPLGPRRLETAARAKRLPGVVRHLAGPDEIPEGGQRGLALEAGCAQEVEPEERAGGEGRPDRVVRLALGRRERARAAQRGCVLAEVERDALEPRPHPDDLAGGGELVESGGLVAGDAARQHVALPEGNR